MVFCPSVSLYVLYYKCFVLDVSVKRILSELCLYMPNMNFSSCQFSTADEVGTSRMHALRPILGLS